MTRLTLDNLDQQIKDGNLEDALFLLKTVLLEDMLHMNYSYLDDYDVDEDEIAEIDSQIWSRILVSLVDKSENAATDEPLLAMV